MRGQRRVCWRSPNLLGIAVVLDLYLGDSPQPVQGWMSWTEAMTRPHVRWLASSTSITWANFPSSPLSTGHPAFQSGLWRTGGMACQYLSVQRVKKLLQEARFGQGTGHDNHKRL